MVNLTIIGAVLATTVILSSVGYYYWETRLEGDLVYGSEEFLAIPEVEIEILGRSFEQDNGIILYPGNWNYKKYTTPFNGKCKERPYVVFMPGSYENAQDALIAFRTHNQEFTIVSGGHDFECVSTGKAAVLNLQLLKEVTVDFEAGVVTVQAGARWRDVYPLIFDSGYEVMGGLCPSVGVSGFVLGGGFNWKLSPLYGSGAENVVEMKVVLENGPMVTMTRDNEYKDLMWGMLGAGGMNFGLALEYKLKLHPYPQLKYNWMEMKSRFSETNEKYPSLAEMIGTIKEWVKFFDERRPEDGYGGNMVYVERIGLDKDYNVYVQGVCRDCDWAEEVKEITDTRPLQETLYMNAEWSWGQYETKFAVGTQTTPFQIINPGLFLSDLSESIVEGIFARILDQDVYTQGIEISTFGGSVRDKDHTSFAFPDAKWKVALNMGAQLKYGEILNQYTAQWKNIVKEEAGRNYEGEYINYIDFNTDDYAKDYFGDNLRKLINLKKEYDPEDFFKRPFGVPLSK